MVRGTVAVVEPADRGVFRAPVRGAVRRSLIIAALWSMVGALVGALVVVVAGLVSGAVVGVAWLVSAGEADLADPDLIWRVATTSSWVAGPLVVGLAVWVAAYASTEWGSRPRALAGSAAALVGMAAYALVGSSGFLVAGLALGWSIAVPAERVARVAARAVLSLIAALFLPRIDSLSGGILVVVLVASPWLTALLVLVGDRAWHLLAGRRGGETGAKLTG